MRLEQFSPEKVCLVVIDPQERLMAKIDRAEEVIARCVMMVRCFRQLGAYILPCTQYQKGLGTYPLALEKAVAGLPRYDKITFNILGDEQIASTVAGLPKQIETFALVGVETHICVYQSALALLEQGYNVWVATDAVSARREEYHREGVAQLRAEGAAAAPAEALLYAMLGRAGTPDFKKILPHIIAQDKDIS